MNHGDIVRVVGKTDILIWYYRYNNYRSQANKWEGLDEYGDGVAGNYYSDDTMLRWLYNGEVERVINPKFKVNLPFPLVYKTEVSYYVWESVSSMKYIDDELKLRHSVAPKELTVQQSWGTLVEGLEKTLVLKVYKKAKSV